MGRRGGLRGGARFLVLGPALSALLVVTGCDRSGGAPHTAPAPAPAPATPGSASAASDAELCTRLVAHWSRQVLDSGTYGDYQSMGLSNGQYELLRDVVDAARVAKRHQGTARVDKLIDRQARRACTERYRDGTPSGGPWQ
ncbi:hypothetical protein [Streptomyces sp. 2231.1]|uniref:hypothetical protein n=1 Tax=Streptomyces sp. 2231.1 TaxID=1855347 RepID=UPI0015A02381|nr:hypothetical protein [Streptomyces sp. 2231.1]